MIDNLRSITIGDFSGGLNSKAGPGAIADNEYSTALNVYLWERGIAKRKGYSAYNSSARINGATAGLGIVEATFVSGSIIVGVAGTKIASKGSGAWTDITGSVSLTTGKPVQFCMQNNNLVGVNDTDPAWYWSGTGNATTLSGANIPTSPQCAESFHGRLWLADGRVLYWSDWMGSWTTFTASNLQNFEDKITGLKVFGDTNESVLVIFLKNGGVYVCRFDTTVGGESGTTNAFTFDRISEQHGCAAINSVKECFRDDGTVFVICADYDGLKGVMPGSPSAPATVVKLTESVQPDWDALNFSYLSDAVGVFYKPRRWYLLFFSDAASTTHNKVLVYDLRYMKPIGFFDWAVSAVGIVKISGIESLVGADYSGYWWQYDNTEADNGAAINAYFLTKSYNDNSPFIKKGFKSVGMEFATLGAYSIDVMTFFDSDAQSSSVITTTTRGNVLGTFVLGTDVLSSDSELGVVAKRIYGNAKSIQLRISNADASEPFRIHRIHVSYVPKRVSIF